MLEQKQKTLKKLLSIGTKTMLQGLVLTWHYPGNEKNIIILESFELVVSVSRQSAYAIHCNM
jgi:hypothetical protein